MPPTSRCQYHGQYPGNNQTGFAEGSISGMVSGSVWVDDPVHNQGCILPSIFIGTFIGLSGRRGSRVQV